MYHHTESLRSVWATASPEHIKQGRDWYPNARALIFELSMAYGTTVEIAAGVVAALSQQCRWSTNIERARHVLDGGNDPGGLPAAVDKAIRIREGEDPEEVLGPRAHKIKAFYRALLGDDAAAVIDTWMLKAFDWAKQGYGPRQYRRLALILSREARKVGLAVTEYQAAVWCSIREDYQ